MALGLADEALDALLARDLDLAPLKTRPRAWHIARERRRLEQVLDGEGFGFVTAGVGLTLVRPLPWDSAHFGFGCADLVRFYVAPGAPETALVELLDATIAAAHAQRVRLLSARPLARDVAAGDLLQRRHGFRLVDTSVELGMRTATATAPQPVAADSIRCRSARAEDLPVIAQMATSFIDNRFHRDPAIEPSAADAVYQRWVESALNRDQLRLVTLDGEVAGFATHRHSTGQLSGDGAPSGVGTIGLVVIGPSHRGRGAFAPLINDSVAHLGCEAIISSTQVFNIAALRAFGRAGLLPIGARQILHGWL